MRIKMSKVPIKNVINHLIRNIDKIKTVEDWAHSTGYSKSYFLRQAREYYGMTPEKILRKVRLIKIVEELHYNPDKIYYAVALDVGLGDDNSLCYFVKKYLDMTPSILKSHVKNAEVFKNFVKHISSELGAGMVNYDIKNTSIDERLVA